MELRWLPEFLAALDEIYERYEAFQEGAGTRAIDRIRSRLLKLADFPMAGRVVPEIGMDELREVVIPPHRVLYLVAGERIDILTIFHGAMDLNLEE